MENAEKPTSKSCSSEQRLLEMPIYNIYHIVVHTVSDMNNLRLVWKFEFFRILENHAREREPLHGCGDDVRNGGPHQDDLNKYGIHHFTFNSNIVCMLFLGH